MSGSGAYPVRCEEWRKVSYIPVDHHQVLLRPLITYEQAKELAENPPENMTDLQREEVEYVLARGQKA